MDPKINHELGWPETADIPITLKVSMGVRNGARRRIRTRRMSKRFRYRSLSDISATVCLATLEHPTKRACSSSSEVSSRSLKEIIMRQSSQRVGRPKGHGARGY